MNEPNQAKTIALGLLGAVLGGWVGYLAFFWAARQGFYVIALPPALLGLGAGFCAGRRSMPLAILCGIAGLGLGLFTEWRSAPFVADASLAYFITHLHSLRGVTLFMIALGVFLSYRLALGVDRGIRAP